MNYYTKPVEGIETIPGPEGMGNVSIIRSAAPDWALVDFPDIDELAAEDDGFRLEDYLNVPIHQSGCNCHKNRNEDWGTY